MQAGACAAQHAGDIVKHRIGVALLLRQVGKRLEMRKQEKANIVSSLAVRILASKSLTSV